MGQVARLPGAQGALHRGLHKAPLWLRYHKGVSNLASVWHDILAFVTGKKDDAENGVVYNQNDRKNEELGSKNYTDKTDLTDDDELDNTKPKVKSTPNPKVSG